MVTYHRNFTSKFHNSVKICTVMVEPSVIHSRDIQEILLHSKVLPSNRDRVECNGSLDLSIPSDTFYTVIA